ncbi:hypothetical protein ACF0H5_022961 [Mactra antiquata]
MLKLHTIETISFDIFPAGYLNLTEELFPNLKIVNISRGLTDDVCDKIRTRVEIVVENQTCQTSNTRATTLTLKMTETEVKETQTTTTTTTKIKATTVSLTTTSMKSWVVIVICILSGVFVLKRYLEQQQQQQPRHNGNPQLRMIRRRNNHIRLENIIVGRRRGRNRCN